MFKFSALPPIFVILAIQAVVSLVLWTAHPYIAALIGYTIPLFWLAIVQGTLAAFLTIVIRMSSWWIVIQCLAPPLLVLGLALQVPLWVFPLIIVLLMAVFWNVAINRVPLYLTNHKTAMRLSSLLPKEQGGHFADLGSGLAGTLHELAALRPDFQFHGFETAPGPFLLSWLKTLVSGKKNVHIHFVSLWKADLSQFKAVYCFLSPVPMADLYKKAASEMTPGSLFISNSFVVPDHKPQRTVAVKDGRKTKLLIWKF
jgi:hypothetical protein